MSDDRTLKDMEYSEYLSGAENPDFLERIENVAGFSYEAETNFLGGWPDDQNKVRRVIFLLQRTVQEALRLSNFHNQSRLETRRFTDGIEFQYGDPDYGFTFSLDGRGILRITRRSSSARQFHEWYRRFMPSLPSIVMESIDAIDEELTGFNREEAIWDQNKDKNRPRVIQVERASYNFRVAIQTPPENQDSGTSIPNIRVLNHSLLRRVPSANGTLTDPLSVEPDEFGRATYQVTRWRDPGKKLEMYQVSGPSDSEWTMLFFDFSYVGDTYVPAKGKRLAFDQTRFVTGAETAEAYLGFFRERAVGGFMHGVLEKESGMGATMNFSTPPSW